MMQKVARQQKGAILIIAAQLGKRHGGRSVRWASEVFIANEYGLTSVAVGSIIMVHRERLTRCEELDPYCAGDVFSDAGDGRFNHAPYFRFSGDRAGFGTVDVLYPSGYCGSASGFLSQ